MKRLLKEKGEDRAGFTLIEMIIVIAIIGILATIVIRSFVFLASARDSKRISDIRTVQNYLELYNNAVGNYPSVSTWSGTGSLTDVLKTTVNVSAPQPVNTAYGYCYSPTDTQGGVPLSYVVGAKLETNSSVIANMPSSLIGQPCGSYTCGSSDNVYCIEPQ